MPKLVTYDNYFEAIFGFFFRKTNFFSIKKGIEIIERHYNKYLLKYKEKFCKEEIKIQSINLTPRPHMYTPIIITKELQNKNFSDYKKERQIIEPKKPTPPFLLFSHEIMQKNKEKISIVKLGEIWKQLEKKEKEKYQKQFQEDQKIYEQKMEAFTKAKFNVDEEELNKTNKKIQAMTLKEDQMINNERACNCGICEECKNYKKKKEEID